MSNFEEWERLFRARGLVPAAHGLYASMERWGKGLIILLAAAAVFGPGIAWLVSA